MTEQNDYLADDARQVEPGELVAFDVPILSSNARAKEIGEMLRFLQDAAAFGAAPYIARVRYDSTGGVCHIDVDETVSLPERARHQLLGAARKHLARFTLCGVNELGESRARIEHPDDTSGYPQAADNDDAVTGNPGPADTLTDPLRDGSAS
ncbi:hypothetical protein [Modicisalibacter radicis]|uniref:hypothetical protein n=1 Tax=Halomonas sp. EAR18 TaxID=2518972 RepID=UPI00109C3A04|nr:hypothetical protein [Halomonas sp. EAR18]